MKYSIGAMTVGDILDRSLKILLARFGTFYAIDLIVLMPLLLFQLAQPALLDPTNQTEALLAFPIIMLFFLVLQPIATAAALHVIAKEFVDEKVGVGDALGFAMGRFLPLLGTSILAGLAILAGVIGCFIGIIIVAIYLAFTSQIVVVEGRSGGDALSRSYNLVKGQFGRVFGILFLVGLIGGVAQFAAGMLAVALPPFEQVPQGLGVAIVVNWPNHVAVTIVGFLVQVAAGTFGAIAATLLYFDSRIRKEGFDLELMATRMGRPDGAEDLP
jgi:hypothetical protein